MIDKKRFIIQFCTFKFFSGTKSIITFLIMTFTIWGWVYSLRKVMTNLDSILKSRDIPLLTKVRLVKAMVFPVVMYGCESWTMKKAEH